MRTVSKEIDAVSAMVRNEAFGSSRRIERRTALVSLLISLTNSSSEKETSKARPEQSRATNTGHPEIQIGALA
jgi:hypothetical protein